MAENEIAVQASGNTVSQITDDVDFYTSLRMNTTAERMAVLRAKNKSVPLSDAIGTKIPVVDVILEGVELANEQTGLIEKTVRITLIDKDGNAYHATSKGIAQSLRQVFKLLGDPTQWEEPFEVTPKEVRGRSKYPFLTLDF